MTALAYIATLRLVGETEADLPFAVLVEPGPMPAMAAEISKEILTAVAQQLGAFVEVWFFPGGDLPPGALHGATGHILGARGDVVAQFTLTAAPTGPACRRAVRTIHTGYHVQTTPGDHLREVTAVKYVGGKHGFTRLVVLSLDGGDTLELDPADSLLSRTPREQQRYAATLAEGLVTA